jgi:hypothetical protein
LDGGACKLQKQLLGSGRATRIFWRKIGALGNAATDTEWLIWDPGVRGCVPQLPKMLCAVAVSAVCFLVTRGLNDHDRALRVLRVWKGSLIWRLGIELMTRNRGPCAIDAAAFNSTHVPL